MDTEELFNKRQDVADGLGIPEEDVNIISPYEPGSYGGMRDAGEFPSLIAAQLAKETGRPCKLEFSRWANLVVGGGRLEGVYDMAAGVDDDGRVIAFDGRTVWNQGEHSANFTHTAGMSFTHWFHPENARWEGYEVFSNRKNVWRRSYGSCEHALASLSFVDELAHAAALRASEMGCDVILKGTQVDGVYSEDPRGNPDARRYDKLSYMDVLSRDLKVMDTSAVALARENNIPILVFSIHEPGALPHVLKGEGQATLIDQAGESA
jgi:CO/xanthine dehydrogenase Mo-binding subunit